MMGKVGSSHHTDIALLDLGQVDQLNSGSKQRHQEDAPYDNLSCDLSVRRRLGFLKSKCEFATVVKN